MSNRPVGIADHSERALIISADDRKRLEDLIHRAKLRNPRGNANLDSLEGELAVARVLPSAEIPPDVVSMHSRVELLDLDSGERMTLTLVFPEEADVQRDRVSVLAPIGTAVLGYRAGDTIHWHVPDGVRRLKVLQVLERPEAGQADGK